MVCNVPLYMYTGSDIPSPRLIPDPTTSHHYSCSLRSWCVLGCCLLERQTSCRTTRGVGRLSAAYTAELRQNLCMCEHDNTNHHSFAHTGTEAVHGSLYKVMGRQIGVDCGGFCTCMHDDTNHHSFIHTVTEARLHTTAPPPRMVQ